MKKLLLILSFSACLFDVNAIVTTTNIEAQVAQSKDSATMAKFTSTMATTMNKMNSTMSSVEQLKNLKGLQKLQGASDLCTLCTKTDQAQLQSYSTSINDDLCSQFSIAYSNLTGVKNAANSLNDIMSLLATDPKAAALSLQQATIAAQQTTNSTLAQMQVMQSQMIQKQLAEEKIQNQQSQTMANSLSKSGL